LFFLVHATLKEMSDEDDEEEEEEEEEEQEEEGESFFRVTPNTNFSHHTFPYDGQKTDEDEDDEIVQKLPAMYMNFEREVFAKNAKKQRKMPTRKPKHRIADIEPPGYGPWWVFMLVNVVSGEDTKKQTEIRLDTYPDLITVIKNNTSQGDWVIVQMLGPFHDLNLALHVQHQWSNSTRGPGSRIARGIVLWSMYREQGVSLYVSGKTKHEMQEYFRACRAKNARAQAEAAERERTISKDVTRAKTQFEKKHLAPSITLSTGEPAKRPGSMSVKEILTMPKGGINKLERDDVASGRKRGRTK
jgi:hypothetical protein